MCFFDFLMIEYLLPQTSHYTKQIIFVHQLFLFLIHNNKWVISSFMTLNSFQHFSHKIAFYYGSGFKCDELKIPELVFDNIFIEFWHTYNLSSLNSCKVKIKTSLFQRRRRSAWLPGRVNYFHIDHIVGFHTEWK